MSVFGILNQEDGTILTHFGERDIISCVFHLGKVHSGGDTCYYLVNNATNPGKNYKVPFHHGTLQLDFSAKSCIGLIIGIDSGLVYNSE